MSNPTASFFEALGRRGHEPLLEDASGTIRFDLAQDHDVDRWFVVITHGNLRVSRDEEGEADCLIHASKAVFDRIVSGRSHVYAAWVRNELRAEGDVRLARFIQRVMPGPPGARHPREFAHERNRPA